MGNNSSKEQRIPKKINYKKVVDLNEIKRYLSIGNFLPNEFFDNNEVNYVLYRKYLTHSDLVNIGKADCVLDGYEKKYILYYDDVVDLEKCTFNLPIAHQSNISLPEDFYKEIEEEKLDTIGRWRNITSSYTCLIPKTIKSEFSIEIIEKIAEMQGKNFYKTSDRNYTKLENNTNDYDEYFMSIDKLSIAAHGIGVKSDKGFYGLRSLMFKGDVLNLLINKKDKKLYIIPERNEIFYFIIKKEKFSYSDLPIYRKYSKDDKKKIIEYFFSLEELKKRESILPIEEVNQLEEIYISELNRRISEYEIRGEFPKYRWYQKQWKESIIKSIALQLKEDNILRCAISGYTTRNRKLEYLFVASHIKSYSDCVADQKWEEAYDPNNGLLLISNVDKLFDQHDICIKQDGKIIKSTICKSLTNNYDILPKKEIGIFYLSDPRKYYLAYHEKKYKKKHKI